MSENPGDGVQDVVSIEWKWAAEEIISDFAVAEDVLDFGVMAASNIGITEVDDDLHIEVLGNGDTSTSLKRPGRGSVAGKSHCSRLE